MKIRTGKDKAWYGITRIPVGARSAAYVVTVKRQGIQLGRHFATSMHGEEGAFKAAQAWRDQVLALLPPMTCRQLRTLVRRNNASGIPGVYRADRPSSAYWVAAVASQGKKQTRSFSIKKYGEEQARQMAIEARRQMLQAVPGQFWVATEASLDLTVQTFDNPNVLESDDAVVWDEATKERILARLRAEGLIDKPRVPSVQKCHFASMSGPVWQALYVTPGGKRIFRRFSVAKYGDKEAERLAWHAYERLKEELSSDGP